MNIYMKFSVVLIEQIAKLTDFVCLSEMYVLLNERHTRWVQYSALLKFYSQIKHLIDHLNVFFWNNMLTY